MTLKLFEDFERHSQWRTQQELIMERIFTIMFKTQYVGVLKGFTLYICRELCFYITIQ